VTGGSSIAVNWMNNAELIRFAELEKDVGIVNQAYDQNLALLSPRTKAGWTHMGFLEKSTRNLNKALARNKADRSKQGHFRTGAFFCAAAQRGRYVTGKLLFCTSTPRQGQT